MTFSNCVVIGVAAYLLIGLVAATWAFAAAYAGTKDAADFNVGFDGLGLLIFGGTLLFWPWILIEILPSKRAPQPPGEPKKNTLGRVGIHAMNDQ